MYQVLLFKFRRHLCKGSIKATDERIQKLNAGLVDLSSRPPPAKSM